MRSCGSSWAAGSWWSCPRGATCAWRHVSPCLSAGFLQEAYWLLLRGRFCGLLLPIELLWASWQAGCFHACAPASMLPSILQQQNCGRQPVIAAQQRSRNRSLASRQVGCSAVLLRGSATSTCDASAGVAAGFCEEGLPLFGSPIPEHGTEVRVP
jgi:hypothetical protein